MSPPGRERSAFPIEHLEGEGSGWTPHKSNSHEALEPDQLEVYCVLRAASMMSAAQGTQDSDRADEYHEAAQVLQMYANRIVLSTLISQAGRVGMASALVQAAQSARVSSLSEGEQHG